MQAQQSLTESSNFASKLSEKLLSFSENEQFCDICIVTSDDVRFHAHKCVLSAFSDYFMMLFRDNLASEIKIHELSGIVFKPILIFLYNGRIELQNDTIDDILEAAIFFQIDPLIGECYNFMGDNLDTNNCLAITMFADQHGLTELSKKASKFATENFAKVSSCKEFLRLDEDKLSELVSREELSVTSEEAVFLNLIQWIEHDKLNREKSAFKLFSKVRYWLLNPDFIKQHRSKLPNQVECLQMICTWLEWHLSPDSSRCILKPMEFSKSRNSHGLVFVGGGGIQTYDPELNIWTREEFSKLPDRFENVVAFKKKLIISREDCPLTCFDLQTHKITNFLPRINAPRSSYGLAVLNDELYVIGGYNYHLHKCRRVVDKYNCNIDKWQTVAPMNNIFFSPKAAVADGQLYVVGDKFLTMQCLNPITNEWTSKPIPDKPNSAFGFTEVGGNLYKIGGKYWDATFKSLQSYQPCNNLWEERRPMKTPLSNPHCISWNNRLIICGGLDERGTPMKLVQEYNPNSNEWRILPQLIEYNCLNYDYALVAFE